MLKIDGKKIMEVAKIPAGPKVGLVLNALMEEVLDDPKLNTEEYLQNQTIKLLALPEKELKILAEKGKEKKEEADEEDLKKIRGKHFVK
jgi:hypothetical protein